MKRAEDRPIIDADGVADRRAKGRERIAEFRGRNGNSGRISVRELRDGTMQVWLFKLSPGTVVICPEANYLPRRAKS
jgi:hypothetical protein